MEQRQSGRHQLVQTYAPVQQLVHKKKKQSAETHTVPVASPPTLLIGREGGLLVFIFRGQRCTGWCLVPRGGLKRGQSNLCASPPPHKCRATTRV